MTPAEEFSVRLRALEAQRQERQRQGQIDLQERQFEALQEHRERTFQAQERQRQFQHFTANEQLQLQRDRVNADIQQARAQSDLARGQLIMDVLGRRRDPDFGEISATQAARIANALGNPRNYGELTEALKGTVSSENLEIAGEKLKNDQARIARDLAQNELIRDNALMMEEFGQPNTLETALKRVQRMMGVNLTPAARLSGEAQGARLSRISTQARAAVTIDSRTKGMVIPPGGGITLSNIQDDIWRDGDILIIPEVKEGGLNLFGLGPIIGPTEGARQLRTMKLDNFIGLAGWISLAESGTTESLNPEVQRRASEARKILRKQGYYKPGKGKNKGFLVEGSELERFDSVVKQNFIMFNKFEDIFPQRTREAMLLPNVEQILKAR
jgi:hypothetical protein